MPTTQTAQKKTSTADQIKLLKAKQDAADADHARRKEAVGIQKQEVAINMAAERESHEMEMARMALDPEVVQMKGLQRLQRKSHEQIADHVIDAATSLVDLHDDAHERLTDVGIQTNRDKVSANKRIVKGVSDVKNRKTKGSLAKVDPDTDDQYRSAVDSMMSQRARLVQPRGLRTSRRTPVKKKLAESSEQRDMWFTGTYVPLSAHHVRGFHEAVAKHAAETGVTPNARIGITGKQKPPHFELPKIPYDCDGLDEYLGHTMLHFNDYLKTNTPIELKMAVARAAHPELADKMHWVKDAFATSPVTGQVPKPGSVIVSDTLAKQAKGSPAYTPIGEGRYQHNRHDLQIHMPTMQNDAEGEKLNTTPLRMTLIYGHSMRRQSTNPTFEQHLNNLHSTMLGVPPDHPGVEQSKRMFDWMSSGWDAVKQAASSHYKLMRPDSVTEARLDLKNTKFPNVTGPIREAAIFSYSHAMMQHLHSDDPNFDRQQAFLDLASVHVPDFDKYKDEIDKFGQMITAGKHTVINQMLPFNPKSDISKVRYLKGMKGKQYFDNLAPRDKYAPAPFGSPGKSDGRSKITEDRRHAAGVGERLLRAQSLQSVGKRIGTKPAPPTNENTLLKRAKRAARYDLRKKLAPNYRNLSTGQKQDVDERIAKHAEFKKLTDTHYAEYKKKYAEKAHTSSHNKKPEHAK